MIINVHGLPKQTRHLGPGNSYPLNYGNAVLPYDQRGTGESPADFSTTGYVDLANDILAEIEIAKQLQEITISKIGLDQGFDTYPRVLVLFSNVPKSVFSYW